MTTVLQKLFDTSNNNSLMSIERWAEKTLSNEEYQSFKEAEKRNMLLMEKYESNGLFRREAVKELVYSSTLKQNIHVTVGVNTILAPGVTVLDIPIDPEYGAWHARYSADPDVNYNPTVQL